MDTLPDLQLVKMPKFLLLEFEMRHQETIKNALESLNLPFMAVGGDAVNCYKIYGKDLGNTDLEAVIKLLYQHFTDLGITTERFGSVNRTTPTP